MPDFKAVVFAEGQLPVIVATPSAVKSAFDGQSWVMFFHIMSCVENFFFFFVYFFGGLECVGHSFAYVAHLWFMRDVWIRTQNVWIRTQKVWIRKIYPTLLRPRTFVHYSFSIIFSQPAGLPNHRDHGSLSQNRPRLSVSSFWLYKKKKLLHMVRRAHSSCAPNTQCRILFLLNCWIFNPAFKIIYVRRPVQTRQK